VRPPPGCDDRIWGRGDGSLLFPKFTGLAVFCTERVHHGDRGDVRVVASAGASAGLSEGSKGAIGMVLQVGGTSILLINCHLAKHSLAKRRDQYAQVRTLRPNAAQA
jgi:hypothetical protein